MDALARTFLFPGGIIPATVAARRPLPSRPGNRRLVLVASDKEGVDKAGLDKWDRMELKFGQYLGEDPDLTMAKIKARKMNPGVSMLDVEKQFKRNKGKIVKMAELPFDVSRRLKKLSGSAEVPDLVQPLPRKGVQFEDKPIPPSPKINEPEKSVTTASNASKRSVPDVLLRKPVMYLEGRPKKPSSRVLTAPNFTLKTSKDRRSTETFSNIKLLRKPEPSTVGAEEEQPNRVDANDESFRYAGSMVARTDDCLTTDKEDDLGIALLKKPEALKNGQQTSVEGFSDPIAHNGIDEKEMKRKVEERETRDDSMSDKEDDIGIALLKQPEALKNGPQNSTEGSPGPIAHSGDDEKERKRKVEEEETRDDSMSALTDSAPIISLKTALQLKPRRLDPSAEKGSASSEKSSVVVSSDTVNDNKNIVPLSAMEDVDWTRAENLVETGEKEDVQLISASLRGYNVMFGSLVGFLPYRNLTTKRKFLAFESWLSQKGLDPSRCKENFHIIGSSDAADKNSISSSTNGTGFDRQNPAEVSADMKLRDLQLIYDQDKLKFLFSSVGQSIRVNVVMADRKLRKLIVSLRPREKDEVLEKKRNLMARLQIGDVVKCCIKKITYCGIFVEIEDVTALIHQTDISWDATLNAVSYYKVGQIVEAKVIQLDFALERIYLSLKETMPDPLTKTLDHLGGDRDPLDGSIEAAEGDAEWPEVDSLIEELQQIEGVQTVSKGSFSLSPALAPTFQVYLASINDKQYKLLARAGNRVQEVIVEASLSKEEMASTILSCATRVK